MASSKIEISKNVQRKLVTLSFTDGWTSSIGQSILGIPQNAQPFAFVSESEYWVIWRSTYEGYYRGLAVGTSNGYVTTGFNGTIEGYVYYWLET